MNKKNLQIITLILSLIPIFTGVIGFCGIKDPLYGELYKTKNILLDTNLRFFSGVWLGLGITMFTISKNITENKNLFKFIWLSIFLGGIGRIISIIDLGLPNIPFIFFTFLEILGAPFFIYWENKISFKN
ncbi:MAG: DUF4345 domain-containing protein [Candidatus Sericytochromatia bacterium]